MSADVVAAMAEAARLAPSIHNSQPWRFVASSDRLAIFADLGRGTPAIDPSGRWLHLACGAAALNAEVAARAAGRICTVALLPDAAQPELLAVLTLGGSCAVHLADAMLAMSVADRHTARTVFEDTEVPPAVVDRLRAAVEHDGAWMHVVRRPEDIVELAVLTERAQAAESADEGYQAELAKWVRLPGQPTDDGIPLDRIPDDVRGSDIPLRDFHGRGPVDRTDASAAEPPAVERPLLVVLGTDGDLPGDWLRAGMAMQRLWLTATAAGLGASPMTQALDHPAPRAMVARLIGEQSGHPQILLRLGYCLVASVTGRRPLADIIAAH